MKTVLFVCVHNSGRSQMAAAYFNHLSGGQNRAISAGTQPSKNVNPTVVQAMLEEGIDISHNQPILLTPDMLQSADKVISMGCIDADACPVRLVPMEDWALPDPKGKTLVEVKMIRDRIKQSVVELLESLKIEGAAK